MATILSIKPVLQVKEGRLGVYKKVRGTKNAKGVLISALKNDLETRFRGVTMNIFAGYSGGDPALGEGGRPGGRVRQGAVMQQQQEKELSFCKEESSFYLRES